MTVLSQLRNLSSAEDFFAFLDVPYDPAVLNVARLHILRRMGQYLSGETLSNADDDEAKSLCRRHLVRAYDDFVKSSPINERVFKVLKDAVKPTSRPLISLSPMPSREEH